MGHCMGIRLRKRETIERLAEKTLEARFVGEVTQGLNCSPLISRRIATSGSPGCALGYRRYALRACHG